MDTRTRQATKLWTLAQPVISAFIGSAVRDFTARDDILQETAVAVIESFDRYDEGRSFVGWALGIAQNQVRMHIRRQKRERLVFDDEVLSVLAEAFETTAVDQQRALGHLRDCFEELPPPSRDLCTLRYRSNLKPAAIALKKGGTANSIAKALQRVRDQLRDCIEHKSAVKGMTS